MNKHLFCIVTIIICQIMVAVSIVECETFPILLEGSTKLYEQGKYQEALQQVETALKSNPTDQEITSGIGLMASCYIKLKEYTKAKQLLEDLINTYPDSEKIGRWKYGIAFNNEKEGNLDAAVKGYQDYIESYPQDKYVPDALYSLAYIYRSEKKYDLALQPISQLKNTFPDNNLIPKTEILEAKCLFNKKEYNKAAIKYKEFIVTHKKSKYMGEAYYFLGSCYENEKGDPDKWINAIECYKKVIDNYPESFYVSRAERNTGVIYYNVGKYDEAILYLKRSLEKKNLGKQTVNSLYYLAKSYQAKGDIEEATKIYKQAIKEFPGDHWANKSQRELDYLASTKPEDRKQIKPNYRLHKKVIKTHITEPQPLPPIAYQSGVELTWEAKPHYQSGKRKSGSEGITSVEIKFVVRKAYARWESKGIGTGGGDQPFKIKWDEGPGPVLITIDKKTGEPSQKNVLGKATVIIKAPTGDIIGESDSVIFVYGDYVKTLEE